MHIAGTTIGFVLWPCWLVVAVPFVVLGGAGAGLLPRLPAGPDHTVPAACGCPSPWQRGGAGAGARGVPSPASRWGFFSLIRSCCWGLSLGPIFSCFNRFSALRGKVGNKRQAGLVARLTRLHPWACCGWESFSRGWPLHPIPSGFKCPSEDQGYAIGFVQAPRTRGFRSKKHTQDSMPAGGLRSKSATKSEISHLRESFSASPRWQRPNRGPFSLDQELG